MYGMAWILCSCIMNYFIIITYKKITVSIYFQCIICLLQRMFYIFLTIYLFSENYTIIIYNFLKVNLRHKIMQVLA